MDEVARHNLARWNALAAEGALFTRPRLDLTPETAQAQVDPEGMLGGLSGRDVLRLAGGGGQQSAAFALLGARVTIVDLSDAQLDRDRQAAAHYGLEVRTLQADMRDLSALPQDSFDIVCQPYSLNFVPDAQAVFAQVRRVMRAGGIYYFAVANPFYAGLTERDWTGDGYALRLPYVEGAEIVTPDADWVFADNESRPKIGECREFRHTLATLLNGPIALGFRLLRVSDTKDIHPDAGAEPGAWDHRNAIAPVWLALWLMLDAAGNR
ncbi:MAG TPA: class I SAM-dependent methyltransferase [Chthonomonadaceae bacterium]|nr:class I SAM-dependent methyltransferase [Chthonomonadaceae bacterium]